MTESQDPIIVVGAGIVGTATALYLRLAGADVTLIDRNPPGSGCSSGNAGMLGSNSCIPSALPGVVRKVPGMMRGPGGALGLRWRDIVRLSPWLTRFVRAGRPKRVEAIADALHALQRDLMPAYETLLKAAGAGHLVRSTGKIHTFESEKTWKDARYGIDLQRRRGIEVETISGDEARELLPLLGPAVTRAIHFPGIAHSTDPQAMIEAFARHFLALGGSIVEDEVRDVTCREAGGDVVTPTRTLPFSKVVIAAGFWSRDMARRLGSRVSMEVQRGYHVVLPSSGHNAPMPMKSEDRKIIITPMDAGMRVTGVAEFSAPDAPATPGRHQALAAHAKALMPALEDRLSDPWIGSRPCTPDSLPVLDRSPHHRQVYFAFGHGHLGLGLGAVSGKVMSELILTGRPSIDLTPYRVTRF